jgi:hypothetical protein
MFFKDATKLVSVKRGTRSVLLPVLSWQQDLQIKNGEFTSIAYSMLASVNEPHAPKNTTMCGRRLSFG